MRKLWLLLPLLVLVTALALYLGEGSEGATIASGDSVADSPVPDSGRLTPPDHRLVRDAAGTDREAVEAQPIEPTELAEAGDPNEPEADDELFIESHPDPLQLGDCALFLEVYDREALEPIRTVVHLWRLDAPGNEFWGAGAQHQATLDVGTDGRWFRELPAGRYRARCLAERRANEDPHEFVVSGDTTRHRLLIDPPRERELQVRLYTSTGEPIREAEFRLGSRGANSHSVGRPDWAAAREPKFESEFTGFGAGGGWSGSRRMPWKSLQADADGWFHPGSVLEGQRDQTPTYRLEARVGDLAHLNHYFDGDTEDLRLVSVVIDARSAERSVVTPDGRESHELEDGLRVVSRVLPFREGRRDAWRHVPIEASRRWESDYEDLEFEFTLDDFPLPTRVLVEKPAKE
jgi:hypothetical protein